jgi:hypothetical protein
MPSFFWTQKQDIGPSSRTSHGLTYDGERKRAVLFGGDPGGPPFADTWSWDGALWTQVADTGPVARSWSCACLRRRAAARGALRRRTAANPLCDTWEREGTEWTRVQDVGPAARLAHAMAFDSTASRVVLFGGAGANGAGLNDTWLWDGMAWTQAADTGPDPRAASAMVPATTIVLFGGVNSIDPSFPSANRIIYGDSWRWDGNAWTEVQHIGPAPRWGHCMAFRSDAGRIVLVGGSSVFGPAQDASLQVGVMRDTWEHVDQGVAPGPAPGPVTIQSLAITPSTVPTSPGGGMANGMITLSGPAPAGGATVQLTMAVSPPEAGPFISLPVSQVTIPANSNSGGFTHPMSCLTSTAGLWPGFRCSHRRARRRSECECDFHTVMHVRDYRL